MNGEPRRRNAARLVVVDTEGAVLLVRYEDHRGTRLHSFWALPGGGVEDGESSREAAQRELLEETGLKARIGEFLWRSRHRFESKGESIDQTEDYFMVRVHHAGPPVVNSSPEGILELRWWNMPDLLETTETIYPEGLCKKLSVRFRDR